MQVVTSTSYPSRILAVLVNSRRLRPSHAHISLRWRVPLQTQGAPGKAGGRGRHASPAQAHAVVHVIVALGMMSATRDGFILLAKRWQFSMLSEDDARQFDEIVHHRRGVAGAF